MSKEMSAKLGSFCWNNLILALLKRKIAQLFPSNPFILMALF